MSRGGIIAIFISLLIVLFFALSWLLSNSLTYYWYETQDEALREEPYGFMAIEEILSANAKGFTESTSGLNDTLSSLPDSTTYVFIGYNYYLDSSQCAALIEYVSKGNDAFIASDDFLPYNLLEQLGLQYDFLSFPMIDSSGTVAMHIMGSETSYPFQFYHADTVTPGYWHYFNTYTMEDSLMRLDHVEPLGMNDSLYNFAVIPVGHGRIFTHLEPRVFSNYYLRTPEGYSYASEVFAHLSMRPIYFDKYNRSYHYQHELDLTHVEGPLDYLFQQPALRNAWITLLVGIMLFLLFRSKRQQRIIPIIPEVENTSIEFAKALGTLYYQSNRTKFLANEMMRLFHTFNRRRYNIQPAKKGVDNSDFIASKSKVNQALIKNIYELERKLKYNEMAKMHELMPLFHALKSYYKSAR